MLQLYTAVQKGYFQHLYLTYNISHIVYRVNLQHNNIFALPAAPTYCCYTTLGKNRMHYINFSNQNYTFTQNFTKYPVCTDSRGTLEPKYHSTCSTGFLCHPHRPELS